MTRLPQVGSDDGSWGSILNDFLLVSHTSDGSFKDGSITEAKLASAVQTKLNSSGGSSTITSNDITDATTTGKGLLTAASIASAKTILALSPSDIGLSNVDNTSDANKPISTSTQTALSGKEPAITAGTTSQYLRGDKSFQTLDKTAVGLANVDNTSDANKPLSTATQTALTSRPPFVFVVTGAEARPAGAANVVWVGGTTRPTNTLAGDLWLSE